MSNQTTRRNVITAAAALPLLPASALSASATIPLLPVSAYAQATDPIIAAFRESVDNLKTGERQC